MKPAPEHKPGLPSVHKARVDRNRGRWSQGTTSFWLWAGAGLALTLIGYRIVSERQLDGQKAELLAKERAVAASVGSAWFPVQDKIEGFVLEAANRPGTSGGGDVIDKEAATWSFRSLPGLFLRLRVAEAKDVASIRKAAANSQKDGFVGCFLREPNVAAARGEADAGAFAEQPWNWQKAYAATRILTDDWITEVKDAPDPLRLKIFEEQYQSAVKTDIPLAIDLVQKAQFFLLVLDEDSEEARALAEGGTVTEAMLQKTPHFARVHLYDLRSGKEVVSVRRSAEASFVFAGEHGATDPETLEAMKRQVNNCQLAKEVDRAITASVAP
jgi:hypothetical protein